MAKKGSGGSRSSWMQRHLNDPFVKKAQQLGYRSRASFKLLEIDARYHVLKPGACVIDLGAAPGGWSQVARESVGESGTIIGMDLLPMDPIDGVICIQGDFQADEGVKKLLEVLGDEQPGLVISDMAPNLSGIKAADQAGIVYLVELALEFADKNLVEGGVLITKCFEGEGIDGLRKAFKARFKRVVNFKPEASRDRSRETYLIGLDYVK